MTLVRLESGATGFIVDSVDEAVKARPHAIAVDRRAVRQRFEQRFSVARVAQSYVDMYRSLLRKGGLQRTSWAGIVVPIKSDPTMVFPMIEERLFDGSLEDIGRADIGIRARSWHS